MAEGKTGEGNNPATGKRDEPSKLARCYVKGIKFRGFKSFKSAEVQMPDGFVALAGPNGSGKSNVTDAIRFALGEMSLKSLRAKKVTELINMNSSKAEVTLYIDGEKKFEIRRAIREDGKTSCSLDGRHLTRTQLLEALRPYGIEVGTHNIIAQGQVQRIAEMNSKDRRGIIDSAAGIAEFDGKKKEALAELGKVDSKISEAKVMLSERGAFLADLEKDKDVALTYQENQAKLKSARATLVHDEYEKLDKYYGELLAKLKESRADVERLEGEISALAKKRDEFEGKRKAIFDKLNGDKEREKLLAGMQSIDMQMATLSARIEEKGITIAKLEEEIKERAGERERSKKALTEMASDEKKQVDELALLRADLAEKKKKAGVTDEAQGGAKEALSQAQEALSKILQEKASLDAKCGSGEELLRVMGERVEGAKSELSSLRGGEEGGEDKAERYRETLKQLGGDLDRLFDRERELNKRLPNLDNELLQKKEQLAALRGSVSPAAQNPALLYVMALKKEGNSGILGTVADLIDVDEKYRVAVEAAAGGRLTFVVVDALDTANKIIAKLKESKAGRCTFIPLDRPITEVETAGAGKAGMGRLIDYVKYDSRLYPAASYVFGDTVLCQNVADAKRIGVGKYRMVTVDGELLERSGIITGGSMRGSLMARSSLLKAESDAEELKRMRDAAYSELYEVREQMQRLRKERGEAELKIRSIEAEVGSVAEKAKRIAQVEGELKKAEGEFAKNKGELDAAKKRLEQIAKDAQGAQAAHENAKKNLLAEEERTKKTSNAAQERYHEALEKYTNLESRINSHKREIEMLTQQLKENDEKAKQDESQLKAAKKALSEAEGEKESFAAQRAKLEATLAEIGKSTQKLYDQMQEFQKEAEAIGAEIGKLSSQKERRKDDAHDIDKKKANAEGRLPELKAEWEKYSNEKLLDASRAELEETVKTCEAKLAAIGNNVNLRAPELFEIRKKEHEEMKGKVSTLESEKAAVLRLVDEIEQKKRTIFMNTFHEVNTHFQKLFKMVFRGEGMLLLDEPSNPLESGLQFRVRGEHDKKDRYLNSMSGGEQTLLSMMFIFALQMHRPAPFYILDEVEAALDKENAHKMADFVRQMSKGAQFIVVTHNDAVLQSADVALGVMKTEDGSKIVGVQLEGSIPIAPGNKPPVPPKEGAADAKGSMPAEGGASAQAQSGKTVPAPEIAQHLQAKAVVKRKK